MKIVILDGFTLNPGDLKWDEIKKLGEVTIYDRTPVDLILQRSIGAKVLITNKTILNKEILDQLPDVKYIGLLSTGFNVVDINETKRRGIYVSNVPGYSTMAVAQMTFALILELCFKVSTHNDSVHNGDWVSSVDFSYWKQPLVELDNKTIGIIGFGKIGRSVANIAKSFGMKVLINTRTKPDLDIDAEIVDFDTLIRNSDVISLHCPLSDENKGIINKQSLIKMKNSTFLINTARGPLIIEQDLADALNNGVIAGAGLDVLNNEPPLSSNPLIITQNCVITPHIAWASYEARSRLMDVATGNLKAFIQGKPINIVNGL